MNTGRTKNESVLVQSVAIQIKAVAAIIPVSFRARPLFGVYTINPRLNKNSCLLCCTRWFFRVNATHRTTFSYNEYLSRSVSFSWCASFCIQTRSRPFDCQCHCNLSAANCSSDATASQVDSLYASALVFRELNRKKTCPHRHTLPQMLH